MAGLNLLRLCAVNKAKISEVDINFHFLSNMQCNDISCECKKIVFSSS